MTGAATSSGTGARLRRGTTHRVVALTATLLLGWALTGCGPAVETRPPGGVDGLTIPTPDPDPGDFVETVDNPWFPLPVGARWTYRAGATGTDTLDQTDPDETDPDETVVSVLEVAEHDGVPVTLVQRTGEAEGARDAVVDAYAQDRAGNVWWFGRDGSWFDEPGLAMPADPRRGDGFRVALTEELDVLAEVVTTEESLNTPAGSFTDGVLLEVTSTVAGSRTTGSRHYARGIGLVAEDDEGLVAHDEALD